MTSSLNPGYLDSAERLQIGEWGNEPAQAADEGHPFRRGNGPEEVRRVERQPEPDPWEFSATVVAVLVFAAVIIAIAVLRGHSTPEPAAGSAQIIPSTPTGTRTTQEQPNRVPNMTGISGVLAWDTEGWPGNGDRHTGALEHQHVTGRVNYAVVPRVGGPHNAIWMNAGVYTKPIPSGRAVHNLDHGAVWTPAPCPAGSGRL